MSADCGLRGLDLLDAAIAHIEAHPETWVQGSYRCASGMCLAGTIGELAGGQWGGPVTDDAVTGHRQCMIREPGDDPRHIAEWECGRGHIHVAERAERLLGISRYVDGPYVGNRDLFDAANTLDGLKAMRDDLRVARS